MRCVEWNETRLRSLIFGCVLIAFILFYASFWLFGKYAVGFQKRFKGEDLIWREAFADNNYYLFSSEGDSVCFSVTERRFKNWGFDPSCKYYYNVQCGDDNLSGVFIATKGDSGTDVVIKSSFGGMETAVKDMHADFDTTLIADIQIVDCLTFDADNSALARGLDRRSDYVEEYTVSRGHGLLGFRMHSGKTYQRCFNVDSIVAE